MSTRSTFMRSLACAGLVAAVLSLAGAAELILRREWSEHIPFAYWLQEILWHSGVIAAGACAAFVATLVWQRRLDRRLDHLLDACQRLALGEPWGLPEIPPKLDDLGRLGLSIQVMREALVGHLSIYRRFFDDSPDMFISLSPVGGIILDANQAFCRTVGRLPSEVLGRPVQEFLSLDQGWDLPLERGQELQGGQLRGERGIIMVEANLTLEQGTQDRNWVMGAILRDVSQREALLQEVLNKSGALEKALSEIRKVEDLKDHFLTTLSHELKTPLVSLKGFLQLIMSDRVGEDDRRHYLDICWRNLGKLEKQINNLLDLARLSHAKEQFEMRPVDLGALVRTEAENLRPLAEEKRVTLDLAGIPGQSLNVIGNPEKLIQLVDNLLLNAVKYNIAGGHILVTLEHREQTVALTVADSGIGIAREHMADIFNRFYQANISGTGRLEGLGIGLSLVQEIVRLHGGDIRVESEPKKGTTFTVVLEVSHEGTAPPSGAFSGG